MSRADPANMITVISSRLPALQITRKVDARQVSHILMLAFNMS